MSEKPILFNGEMVRAILAGRKTQTRRPVKGIPADESPEDPAGFFDPLRVDRAGEAYPGEPVFGIFGGSQGDGWDLTAPYKPGDVLWVRETFCPFDGAPEWFDRGTNAYYRADGEEHDTPHHRWVPSIHMKRRYARLFLEVTAVRCERVRDITVEDIIVEGFTTKFRESEACDDLRAQWEKTWSAIYGPDLDAWCWVYEFKRKEAGRV